MQDLTCHVSHALRHALRASKCHELDQLAGGLLSLSVHGQRVGTMSVFVLSFEQARPNHLVGPGGRWSWRSAPTARQGLVPHQCATLRQRRPAVLIDCRVYRRRRTGTGHESPLPR